MIWVAILLLAVCALAPMAVAFEDRLTLRGAREPALALHRTQLQELDRDLAEGRILPPEHGAATLEVQRRLLHVADQADGTLRPGSRTPLLATLLLVPLAAAGLYAYGGSPGMPSVVAADASERRAMEDELLVLQLRERLAGLDPRTDQARTGYILLGNVEASRGHEVDALQAWRIALSTRFDPALAVRIADAAIRTEGRITSTTANLLRRALAAAPPDAPWRSAVEDQLRQSGF